MRRPFSMPCALHLAVVALLVCAATASVRAGAVAPSATDTSAVSAQPHSSGLPEGWQHGAFMEILVRAWRDSNGDGVGDLRGLIQSLDDLQALGIRGLWLMPVTAHALGDRGDAPTHFRDIAPEYGTLADFDELIAQAHRRGIAVGMDYVMHHAAAQHPMFQQALQGPANPFHDWFVWSAQAPQGRDIQGRNPWHAATGEPWNAAGRAQGLAQPAPDARGFYFAPSGPHLPDFNLRNPAVVAYHLSSLRFWFNRGLDGVRLGALPHLVENSATGSNDAPESRRITQQLQDLVNSYPQRCLVSASPTPTPVDGPAAPCGGGVAWGQANRFVQAAKGDPEAVEKVATHYNKSAPTLATGLSSRDPGAGRRLWDQVGGDLKQYKLAAAGYLLQPGTPVVLYGEEVGQGGVDVLKGGAAAGGLTSGVPIGPMGPIGPIDPVGPLAPQVAAHNVPSPLAEGLGILGFYKSMMALRNTLPSIARGSFEAGTAQGLVASWQRKWQGEHTVVLINYGTQVALAQMAQLPAHKLLHSAYPAGGAQAAKSNAQGLAELWLAPQSVRVLVVVGTSAKAGGKANQAGARPGKAGAKAGGKATKSSPKSGTKASNKASKNKKAAKSTAKTRSATKPSARARA